MSQLVLIGLVAADALAASPARLVNPLQPGPFAASDVETFVARGSVDHPIHAIEQALRQR